ncbi:MAG: UvrD-helicase domain-containing protein [Anaerolineaceae bacterium]|nr:UvrD-helicase domain-containing protein [Anaerolineaceae bacterium]
MTVRLTSEQQKAVSINDQNIVVVAAAGSGKTRVLVERYIALLEANPDWPLESLVAITFTRKATHEMRVRLRQELQARVRAANNSQRELWVKRLAQVDNARIDTIHGLCADILRISAAEAGVDPEFEVLDDDEAAIDFEHALQEEMELLASQDDPSMTLFLNYDRKQITEALLEQAKQPEVPKLGDFSPQGLQRYRDDLVLMWKEELLRTTEFSSFVHWQPPEGWPENDRIGNVWESCLELSQDLIDTSESDKVLELFANFKAAIVLTGGSSRNWGGKETFDEAKKLLRELRKEVTRAIEQVGDGLTTLDHSLGELLPLWHRLVTQMQWAYRERKRARNQLQYMDLERLTRDVLQQPEVLERFRREFNQVLVDEFHDTSPIQWEIIRGLANPCEPGRLFIVGDPRQSIYGFRGADVRVFGEARRAILEADASNVEVNLRHSFRSHQQLLGMLNGIFSNLLVRSGSGTSNEYEVEFGVPLVANRQEKHCSNPAVELLVLDNNEADIKGIDEKYRLLALCLGIRLREMVVQGIPIIDKTKNERRSLEYGDIALLFQTHRHRSKFEDAFGDLNLPWMTVDGRGFYGRQEVLDLLNLLRVLHSTQDELALASVLRSPLFALSDDGLLALRLMKDENGKPVNLWDALQQPRGLPEVDMPRAGLAAKCLFHLAQIAGRLTVDDLLREALRQTGFLATLSGLPDGERRRGNVEKLLGKAAISRELLFTEFEQQLGNLSQRDVREGENALDSGGAITLMTVHQAKGLEFPLVVLTDAEREPGGGDNRDVLMRDEEIGLACKVFDMQSGTHKANVAWKLATMRRKAKDQAEHKRLFYVAATRARDYLMICGLVEGKPGEKSWLAVLSDELDFLNRSPEVPFSFCGGKVIWRKLVAYPAIDPSASPEREAAALEQANARTGDEWDAPDLLRAVPAKPPGLLREIYVTTLSEHYERRVMRSVGTMSPPGDAEAQRQLGNVLHGLLRQWRPGRDLNADPMQGRLASLLWQQRVRSPQRRAALQRQATAMLARFEASALAERMRRAPLLLQELPFMQRHGDCLIQGSIDLVMRDAAGNWTLVDFKSSHLGEEAEHNRAKDHARRYGLQLGLYANALLQRPEVEPGKLTVQVHYLLHGLDVTLPTAAWQGALTELDELFAVELADSLVAS